MTKIKICGLVMPSDIQYVNKYLPDYIGFVFAPSKRQITFETAKELKQALNPAIKAVGVFVDEAHENIIKLVNENIIDIVQLHGSENEEYILALRQKVSAPIIKVNAAGGDYILFDNSSGGSGKTFNWDTIKTAKGSFLAGGLNASNVEAAIKKLNPYCVDLSSGVETDGKKDAAKIKEIINIVRGIK